MHPKRFQPSRRARNKACFGTFWTKRPIRSIRQTAALFWPANCAIEPAWMTLLWIAW